MTGDGPNQEATGRTVVGMFTQRADAEAAIRDLKDAGFPEDRIGVAMRDEQEQRGLAEDTGTQAAEGAATGALSGGVIGGLMGLLGSLLIPGLGPIVVGGVLASTLTGAGIGAATGGLIGALAGLGVPEEDARHFDLGLRSGGILVTVSAGSRTGRALAILERHGMDLGPTRGRHLRSRDAESTEDATAAGAVGTGGIAGSTLGDVGLGTTEAGHRSGAADVAGGSSTGDRGMSRSAWEGLDRRTHDDPEYTGPERRLVGV
ncbi:MAG: general stress protein [Gemmatimonadales bacterium]|nr:general stress protein [Gemmatimonadales bacterium]